jgi:hypothetical protein
MLRGRFLSYIFLNRKIKFFSPSWVLRNLSLSQVCVFLCFVPPLFLYFSLMPSFHLLQQFWFKSATISLAWHMPNILYILHLLQSSCDLYVTFFTLYRSYEQTILANLVASTFLLWISLFQGERQLLCRKASTYYTFLFVSLSIFAES